MRTTIAALAVAGLLAACGGPTAAEQQAKAAQSAADYTEAMSQTVLYEVEGTDGAEAASITLHTPTGTQQNTNAALPMTSKSGAVGVTFTVLPGDDPLYLSAQNLSDSGTITCRITVQDRVISENSASGLGAIAECEGTA